MKRLKIITATVLLLLICVGCYGKVSNVQFQLEPSKKFSQKELEEAAEVVKKEFRKEYYGCELLEISYSEKKSKEELNYFDVDHNNFEANKTLVLFSKFKVVKKTDQVAFEVGKVYNEWKWVLSKNKETGKFEILSSGLN